MKFYAHYNQNGTIKSLISFAGPEGAGLHLSAGFGIMISEIQGVSVNSEKNLAEELRRIAGEQRISKPAHTATLSKK